MLGVRARQRLTFREWLAASPYRGSPTAFARAHRIPRTTVQEWARGAVVGPAYRERLRAITGIRDFATTAPERARAGAAVERRAQRVRTLVRELARELARFGGADERPRAVLRARTGTSTS